MSSWVINADGKPTKHFSETTLLTLYKVMVPQSSKTHMTGPQTLVSPDLISLLTNAP